MRLRVGFLLTRMVEFCRFRTSWHTIGTLDLGGLIADRRSETFFVLTARDTARPVRKPFLDTSISRAAPFPDLEAFRTRGASLGTPAPAGHRKWIRDANGAVPKRHQTSPQPVSLRTFGLPTSPGSPLWAGRRVALLPGCQDASQQIEDSPVSSTRSTSVAGIRRQANKL